MTNRLFVLVAALVANSFSMEAVACSCAWQGTFVDYARQSEGVIRARVVSYGDKLTHGDTLFESMTVDVVTVLKGDLQYESIELLGDPGFLCRDYVDSRVFVIGREYLIALHGDARVQPLGGCGEAFLAIVDGVVKGYDWTDAGNEEYSMPLDDMLDMLNAD